ncbi:MAG: hypothetical protein PWP16_1319 [Eubacteriaceae bacterium]|nr:hypothetical protein [Eubacteriaceae bacterium]
MNKDLYIELLENEIKSLKSDQEWQTRSYIEQIDQYRKMAEKAKRLESGSESWKFESDLWQEQYEMLDYCAGSLISDLADQLMDCDDQSEIIEMLEKQRDENLLESKKDNYDNGMEINRLKREVKELKEDNESLSDELIETAKDMNDLWADYADEITKLQEKYESLAYFSEESEKNREKIFEENKTLKEQMADAEKKNIENIGEELPVKKVSDEKSKKSEKENKATIEDSAEKGKENISGADPLKQSKDKLINKGYKVEKSGNGYVAKKKGTRNIELKNAPLPGSPMFVVCDVKIYNINEAIKASVYGISKTEDRKWQGQLFQA